MSDTKYNGWANYETWVVNLWLDNEQGTQEMVQEWAQAFLNTAEGDKDEARHALAQQLEEWHDDIDNYPRPTTGVLADLVTHALGMVDWDEIAEAALADVVYGAPYANEGDAE